MPLLVYNLIVCKQHNQHRQQISNRGKKTTMKPTRSSQVSMKGCLLLSTIVVVTITFQLLPQIAHCQDFEDLNNKQATNHQSHHTFLPLNRQQLQQTAVPTSANQHVSSSRQRPGLSSRFAPQSANHLQQQLIAQASSSASVISPASPLPVVAAATSQQQPQVSNIEQLMKNALARTAQLNSAAASSSSAPAVMESRQDTAPPPPSLVSQQQASSSSLPIASSASDKLAESSETSASESGSQPDDSSDKQTTTAQLTTTNGHETVYSEQRFANLFARRNTGLKKSKITPTEQVKAKPTLPSFIKSLPDPKQFNAAQLQANQDQASTRPALGSASFASQRVQQQQNQGRINLALNQQKKVVVTSNSASQANNKRANSLNNNKPTTGASITKPAASNLKSNQAGTKPSVAPVSNNPFNRSQSSNNDPANVIAMARKRLLANNALESAKLKQQQQQQKSQTTTN